MTDQETAETPPEDEEHQGFSPKALLVVFLLAAVPVMLALVISIGGGDGEGPSEIADQLPRDAIVRPREQPIRPPESQRAPPRPQPPASPPTQTAARPQQQPANPPQQATQQTAIQPVSPPQAVTPAQPEIGQLRPAVPLEIELLTPRGSTPVYSVNEELELTVDLSKSAYVYCYYQDGAGSIARIFPNRFRPDSFVQVDTPLHIPGQDSRFDIVFELANSFEAIGCYASEQDLDARLPETLQQDLTPLPFSSLEQVAAALAQQSPTSIAQARLQIRVN